ncbi:beta strand repeat-containing protein, partial [Acinetobacter variabilis]
GVSFNGTANINLPGVNTTGNQNTTGSAAKLTTARTLSLTGDATGSLSFDGSANASAALTLASTGIAAGTYKSITVDAKGRATAGTDVVTGLVTSSSATGVSNVATTNTNTFLNITEKVGTATASAGTSTQVTGAGTVTVSSDTAGKITITGAQSITGNAATATKLATARTISLTGNATGSTTFDGSGNVSISVNVGDDTHNHTTLSALPTYAKTAANLPMDWDKGVQATFVNTGAGYPSYGGVTTIRPHSNGGGALQLYTPYGTGYGGDTVAMRFGNYNSNGGNSWTEFKYLVHDKNIDQYAPGKTGSGASGTWGIAITGNAATATKLATARTIGGVSFNGTANINLPGVNTAGNQNTSGNAATATKLQTARTLSLTGDATGSLSFDGSANASAALTLASTGIAAGTYRSVTVDAKGRATAGNPVVIGLVTSSTATGVSNVATTNTNTFLNITEKVGTATASAGTSTQVVGAGTVTVSSDTAGKITITGAQSITGNAATATKLATARTIGGVSFDGTANINLPGVNTTGNQNTSGNAATATKLQTPRAINGVNFDGTAAINLPLLGYDQSWQNLKASRALNTVYTNSTGKPIMVMVSIETSDDWGEPTVQVNDVQIARTLGYQSSGTGHWGMNISFIVPAGHTYQVISKVAGSYMEWAELR